MEVKLAPMATDIRWTTESALRDLVPLSHQQQLL